MEGIEVGLPYGRKAPIFFSIIGQISPNNCYLTQHGRRLAVDSDGMEDLEDAREDAEVATFWFEERPNAVSALSWQGIGKSVRAITAHFPEPNKVDTSRLAHYSTEELKYRLQFIWHGRPGEVSYPFSLFPCF